MKLILILLVLLVIAVLVIKFTPWYVSVGLAILLFFGGKFLIKKIIYNIFTAPFKMKGQVLHEASAKVNGIKPTEMPDPSAKPEKSEDDDEDEEDDDEDEEDEDDKEEMERQLKDFKSRTWFNLDVTITPRPATGEFTHWEPGELLLVPIDKDTSNIADDDDDADDEGVCIIHDEKIWSDGSFVEDEDCKYGGEQRLQLTIGVKPGAGKLKFQYYFEGFGEVEIPKG